MNNLESIKIIPSKLIGEIKPPPSKSLCHRAIICASLSEGKSIINNFVMSDDMKATISGMRAFGANIVEIAENGVSNSKALEILGAYKKVEKTIDCIESGSTLRFLIPLALLSEKETIFLGRGRLVERPIDPYLNIFEKNNISYEFKDNKLPLSVFGKLKSGKYELRGDISSQFVTGLLFVLPMLEGDSEIIMTSELESKAYVDLTLDVMRDFGVFAENEAYSRFKIKGSQNYKNCNYKVESDFSQAAFWIVAEALGNQISYKDMNINSKQSDRVILDIVKKYKTATGEDIIIDVKDCPDLVPILAVLASFYFGKTKIINAARVRIKESDRLKAISCELNKLGANIIEFEDGLDIEGVTEFSGGVVESWNDHRIAMALAIASTRCTSKLTIIGSECVKKSYPHFWEDFKMLGGKLDEWNSR